MTWQVGQPHQPEATLARWKVDECRAGRSLGGCDPCPLIELWVEDIGPMDLESSPDAQFDQLYLGGCSSHREGQPNSGFDHWKRVLIVLGLPGGHSLAVDKIGHRVIVLTPTPIRMNSCNYLVNHQ